jgi:3-phosphoshikimate 1-carboxyvinyltransferase
MTVIQDAAELGVKESDCPSGTGKADRIAVMASQLNRMGARVTELPDGLEIIGGTPLVGTDVDSHTDHRIAMSLAVAALNATGTTTIHGAEAAGISYPDFTTTLQRLCDQG